MNVRYSNKATNPKNMRKAMRANTSIVRNKTKLMLKVVPHNKATRVSRK